MKNKLSILTFIIFNISFIMAQEININIKPEPLSDIKYPFPKYEIEKLKNGIKVYLIEDKEQPTIGFRIMINGGGYLDGNKVGLSEFTASLITKGTQKRSAEEIANTLDGVGASINSSSSSDFISIYAQSLKKHQKILLDVLSDLILNSKFPKDEFEKLQKQMIASVQYEKSNPSSIAQQLSRIALYGKNHPYAQRNTESSINLLNQEDIVEFYSNYFKSNNASIAVIGDFNKKSILKDLENYFGKWEEGKIKPIENIALNKAPKGVYFINRPGSVQSTIVLTTTTVPYNDPFYETLGLTSNIIGSFAGRLFATLREKYSYTYTPYGYQSKTRFINRFTCGADVASNKTEASIDVIIDELNKIKDYTISQDELDRMRQFSLGTYLMSLENSPYIASLIQNTDLYSMYPEELANYPNRINSLSIYDINSVAKKYIDPSNAIIVVVGDPSIKENLKKFGNIFEYDLDLNPLDGAEAKLEKINISSDKLLERYIDAIGGTKNIDKIENIKISNNSEMNVGGQVFTGEETTFKTKSGNMYQKSDFRVFDSETWVEGNNTYISIQKTVSKLEGKENIKLLIDAGIIPLMRLKDNSYSLEVLGRNKNFILLLVTTRYNDKTTYYFDKDSYLLMKVESIMEGPKGNELFIEKIDSYTEINGVKLPQNTSTSSSMVNRSNKYTYEVNIPIDNSIFKPRE